jgi:hypothetical protein
VDLVDWKRRRLTRLPAMRCADPGARAGASSRSRPPLLKKYADGANLPVAPDL